MKLLFNLYRFFFAKPFFLKMNKLLYRLSLSGLGILNYENDKVSGESVFLEMYFKNNQGGIVFDVGANVGNYTKSILKFNPEALVYAFEPHPLTFNKLTNNMSGIFFNAINFAVGDNSSELSLYDYKINDGSSHASLYKDVIENIHKSPSVEHKVNVISLDEFVAMNGLNIISLLKIDVEGNELNVLKGSKKIIGEGRVLAIHFEFNEMNISSRTYFRDFWDMLTNYEFYRLLPNDMVKIEEYASIYCELFAYQNIVAILKPSELIPKK
jgi:FkbM family methyltransferase